jgi:hypothetical protein
MTKKEKIVDNENKVHENSSEQTGEEKHEKIKSRDKQSLIFLGIFAALILIVIFALAFKGMGSKFTYEGIKFTKGQQGSVIFYTAKVPLINPQGTVYKYAEIDFRNDPRKLKSIPVNIEEIKVNADKVFYTAYDNLKICEDNMLAAVNLDTFLSDTGIKNKRSGLANESYARETNLTYVNCNTNPENTVLLIKNGPETKIEQTAENCYEIISNDCDILQAIERFQLAVLEQHMKSISD